MKVTCPTCSKEWGGLRAAHCSGCHNTFVSPLAFDLHQALKRDGSTTCKHPSASGLVFVPEKSWYRFMKPEEEDDARG